MTLPQVLQVLQEEGSVGVDLVASVQAFLAGNQVTVSADNKASIVPAPPAAKRAKVASHPTYEARAAACTNAAGKTLLEVSDPPPKKKPSPYPL